MPRRNAKGGTPARAPSAAGRVGVGATPRKSVTLPRWERPLIIALCAVAAVRVFLFAAAFPFFNNVDEQAHVDLVLKYARGDWPRQMIERFDPASGRLFVLYGSSEYLAAPERFPGGIIPRPLWSNPALADRLLGEGVRQWTAHVNHEAHSPPVYYALAGAWYTLSGWLGLTDGQRLYWVRFLNVILFALLVWFAYRFCLETYGDRPELRIGVPLLLTFLPQDVFYSVNSDVLSPLLFVVSLSLLLTWYRRDEPGVALSGALGALVSLTFLVKFTNIALLVILGATILLKVRQARGERVRDALVPSVVALLAALLPLVLWFGRNYVLFGDLTGMQAKVEFLGWSPRRFGALFSHPIFTPRGVSEFWDSLMRTFWRGEFVWHLKPIANPALDTFYTLSSLALLIAAAVAWRARNAAVTEREAGPNGDVAGHAAVWASVLLSLLCLVALSVSFEYGRSFYPSQHHPYFTSGRLIAGALVPFLVLYLDGIAFLMRPVAPVIGTLVVAASLSLVMTVSEMQLTWHIFANLDNWFHVR